MAIAGQYILVNGTSTPTPAEEPSRTFSLRYLYELCLIYLHSSVVPILACRAETPILSQSAQRLAAEQAWERSTKLTTMMERYLSGGGCVSKLWPIVGYGAYVCAVVQIRRCLSFDMLEEQWLERAKVHLKVTEELGKYWMTLRPLVRFYPSLSGLFFSTSVV